MVEGEGYYRQPPGLDQSIEYAQLDELAVTALI